MIGNFLKRNPLDPEDLLFKDISGFIWRRFFGEAFNHSFHFWQIKYDCKFLKRNPLNPEDLLFKDFSGYIWRRFFDEESNHSFHYW